jgi:hypothetical protein
VQKCTQNANTLVWSCVNKYGCNKCPGAVHKVGADGSNVHAAQGAPTTGPYTSTPPKGVLNRWSGTVCANNVPIPP